MKKLFLIISAILIAISASAQSNSKAKAVLDKTASVIRNAGDIKADFSATSTSGSMSGTVFLHKNMLHLTSPGIKCWYDGKTLWTYRKETNEVNITSPTADELQMTNPVAAVQHFKQGFNMKRAKAKTASTYVIKLTPKQKKDAIKTLWLYFDEKTSLLRTARFEMSDKSVYFVKITNYRHKSLPSATFTFDKSMVPAGTQVVDLR